MSANDSSRKSYYDGKGGYRELAEGVRKEMKDSIAYRTGENAYRAPQDTPPQDAALTSPDVSHMKDNKIYLDYRGKTQVATTGQPQSREPGVWDGISGAKGKAEGPPSSTAATAGSRDQNTGGDTTHASSEAEEISSVAADDGYDESAGGDPDIGTGRRVSMIRATVRPKSQADKTKTAGEEK